MSIATVCKKQTKAENRQETEKTVRRQIYGDLSDGRFFNFLFGKIRRIIKNRGVYSGTRKTVGTASGKDNIHRRGGNI